MRVKAGCLKNQYAKPPVICFFDSNLKILCLLQEVDDTDDVFFSFKAEKPRARKERLPGFLPGIEEEKSAPSAFPPEGRDEIEGPPQ